MVHQVRLGGIAKELVGIKEVIKVNIANMVTLCIWVVLLFIKLDRHFSEIKKEEEEINKNLRKIINILNKRK